MTEEDYLNEIRKTKKQKRQFDDYTDYFILIFPAGIIFIGLSMAMGYFKHKLGIEELLISLLTISVGIIFARFTLKRLKENITFETIENTNNLDLENLIIAIENNFRINDIYIDEKEGVIEVFTKPTGFSWGEYITIIKDGNTFLINSRPGGSKQPVTIFKDRKNIKKIRKILTE